MDTIMQHSPEHGDDNKSSNTEHNNTNDESHDGGIGDRDIETTTRTTTATSITELELITKLRLAFAAMLQMLEAARDNLVTLGERMDRLHDTSRQCRMALLLQKQQQEQHEQQQSSQAERMGTLSTATEISSSLPTLPRAD
jgi:BMFP domain-containing protein YqiC